jgi:monoterpene epsilon-lactone hydrolase
MIRGAILKMVIRYYSRRTKSYHYKILRKRAELSISRIFKRPAKCIIDPVNAGGVPAEFVSWRGADGNRTILYLHGGGYVLCSPKTHRDLVWRIARVAKARMLSIDYRLAPENPHPSAVDDALAAYQWLLESGTEPSRMAVMGDSAGGGLTLVLLHTLRDRGIPLPACAVCMSPWTDLTCTGASVRENEKLDPLLRKDLLEGYARYYAPEGDLALPSISPLFGDFSNLPPILIQVGTDELLLDDSRRVAVKAAKENVPVELQVWPRMMHVFQALTYFFPEAKKAIAEIGRFIDAHIPDVICN